MKNNKDFYNGLTVFYKGSARIRNYYEQYRRTAATTLRDVYDRYSGAKQNAFDYCVNLQKGCDGYRGRVVSYCTNYFTYGFLYEYCGRCYFAIITPAKNESAPVDELVKGWNI